MADGTETSGSDAAARLRAVRSETDRVRGDSTSLARSLKELVEIHAREQPLQTVAIALGIGWLMGKRI